MANMDKRARLVDEQGDLFVRIEADVTNLRKLNKEKREPTVIRTSYDRIIKLSWIPFVNNHRKLITYKDTPRWYYAKYNDALDQVTKLHEFASRYVTELESLPVEFPIYELRAPSVDDNEAGSGEHAGKTNNDPPPRENVNISPKDKSKDDPAKTATNIDDPMGDGTKAAANGDPVKYPPSAPSPSRIVPSNFAIGVNHHDFPIAAWRRNLDLARADNFAYGGPPVGRGIDDDPNAQRNSQLNQQAPPQPRNPLEQAQQQQHPGAYWQQPGVNPQFANNPVPGGQGPWGYPMMYPPYGYPMQGYGYAAPPPMAQPTTRGLRVADLKLKPFEGDFNEYRNFKNSFLRMHSDYQTHEKFEYLREKLRGDAYRKIAHLENIDANYDKAWEILDKRFNNPRFQIEANLNKLDDGLPDAYPGKYKSIEALHEAAVGMFSNLEGLDISWKDIFAFKVVCRLKGELRTSFYKTLDAGAIATVDKVFDYLENIQQNYSTTCEDKYLHGSDAHKREVKFSAHSDSNQRSKRKPKSLVHAAIDGVVSAPPPRPENSSFGGCFICRGTHTVPECVTFVQSANRDKLLKEHRVCIYCLKHKWSMTSPCRSRDYLKCETCGDRHVKEWHTPGQNVQQTSSAVSQPTPPPANLLQQLTQQVTSTHCTSHAMVSKQANSSSDAATENNSKVVLPTAIISVLNRNGDEFQARALIDQCSQSCYITENLVQNLNLRKSAANVVVIGVGGTRSKAAGQVRLTLKVGTDTMDVTAFVVPRITDKLPGVNCEIKHAVRDLPLADPMLSRPASVKLLLGGEVYSKIMRNGVKRFSGYLLQNSSLGWIVSGLRNTDNADASIVSTHVAQIEDSQQLWINAEEKFKALWEMPFLADEMKSEEPEFCEQQFKTQYYRTDDGRYVIPIPWKPDAPAFGSSYEAAAKFYYGQEYRWNANKEHKAMSDAFMREYIDLNHMTQMSYPNVKKDDGKVFYIPYISIMRKDALTTKLRNVFNGSAESSNGVTLNSCIYPGPNLLTRITDVITRLRQHRYIYGADVEKFFRQVLLRPEDQERLRILWRPNRYTALQEFKLNTITYGLDCSPFQAIRTMHQVADDNAPDDKTKEIIKRDFYVDDLGSGASTIDECKRQIQKIISTLNAGQLPLTKWVANHPDILSELDEKVKLEAYVEKPLLQKPAKMLGLLYDPHHDSFSINIKPATEITYTKRGLLSVCASIYDPLGFLLPVVMKLRLLLQDIWRAGLDWDIPIDQSARDQFDKCLDKIEELRNVRIPRWTGDDSENDSEFIGFCDASGSAYAAVLYCRTKVSDSYRVSLIASTGHVVPLKTGKVGVKKDKSDTSSDENADVPVDKPRINSELTIPKLELESIRLMTELIKTHAKNFSRPKTYRVYTDSEIALAWVRSTKTIDNKYVQKKVNEIRKIISPDQLHHVKTFDNPADYPSRGINAAQLIDCPLWFNGPLWLSKPELPCTPFQYLIETMTNATVTSPEVDDGVFLDKFSEWKSLLRAVAHALRISSPQTGAFTAEEIIKAKVRIILLQQKRAYGAEIQKLKNGKSLPKKHPLVTLNAFIDDRDGFLRVGGRISRSDLSYDARHPIILPKSNVASLLIAYKHREYGHAGNQQLENLMKGTFYIPSLRSTVRMCIKRCKTCVRWRGATTQPMMADLPKERVTYQPSFFAVSVDLAGPFIVKASRIRSDRDIKCWTAIFVCQSTKMVHLEACLDLSTEEFLAAFQRFSSRRGVPTQILSDNQTNFVLANKMLRQAWKKVSEDSASKLALQEIRWTFSPPRSPHFNGLAEAMVKTFKFFLKRTNNSERLRYDEFLTTLCRIEGYMNSRPLTKNATDPDQPSALTPFLLCQQRQLKPFILDEVMPTGNPLSKRYHYMLWLQQELRNRFESEYITQLQKRYKWKQPPRAVALGDVVLVKDLGVAPPRWPLAFVEKLYPDESGYVRRVDLRTATGHMHRAVEHLVHLLEDESDDTKPAKKQNREVEELNATIKTTVEDESTAPSDSSTTPEITAPSDSSTPPEITDPSTTTDKTAPSDSLSTLETTTPSDSSTPPKTTTPLEDQRRSTKKKVGAKAPVTATVTVDDGQTDAPDASPAEPSSSAPRRSPRLSKKLTLFSSILFCLLVTAASQPLPRSNRAIAIPFDVITTVNLTEDVTFIRQQVDDFKTFCTTRMSRQKLELKNHCAKTANRVATEAELIVKEISAPFVNARVPRAVGAIIQTIARSGVAKHIPNMILLAGMGYSIVDGIRTRAEVDELRKRQIKIAEISLKLEEINHENFDLTIQNILNQQRTIQLETEITEFATTLSLAIQTIATKYRDLSDFEPTPDMMNRLADHIAEMPGFELMPVDSAKLLFTYYEVSKSLVNDFVVVHCLIPVVATAQREDLLAELARGEEEVAAPVVAELNVDVPNAPHESHHLEITSVAPDPRRNELRHQLQHQVELLREADKWTLEWWHIAIITTAACCILGLIIYCGCRCYKSTRQLRVTCPNNDDDDHLAKKNNDWVVAWTAAT